MNVFSRVFGKAVYHFTSNWFLVNDTKTNIGCVIQYTLFLLFTLTQDTSEPLSVNLVLSNPYTIKRSIVLFLFWAFNILFPYHYVMVGQSLMHTNRPNDSQEPLPMAMKWTRCWPSLSVLTPLTLSPIRDTRKNRDERGNWFSVRW